MASSLAILLSSDNTYCACNTSFLDSGITIGYSACHSRICSSHASCVVGSTRALSSVNTCFKSPTIGTLIVTFLSISAGSISIWMILAFLQKKSGWPVMRSWKRIPAAITRSASSVLLLAATEPCIPTIPRANS